MRRANSSTTTSRSGKNGRSGYNRYSSGNQQPRVNNMSDRPYIYYELTNSLCHRCLRKVEAKVVIEDGNVYLHKWCPEHRFSKVLISTDADYYKLCRQTL